MISFRNFHGEDLILTDDLPTEYDAEEETE